MRSVAFLSVLVCLSASVSPVFSKGNPDYAAGAAFFQRDDYFSALHSFQLALQTSPGDPNILYGIASCLSKLKRSAEARSFYEKTIAAAPNSKLGNYSRDGIKYLDTVSSESSPHRSRLNGTIAQNPGSISVSNGPFSLNPLPVAQPASYFPPTGNSSGWSGQQNPGQYGNPYHSHHHRFSDPYNSGGTVGPYTMMPHGNQQLYSSGNYMPSYHVPSMVIKEYSFPPSPPVLSVELMAKQEKLVADEKKPK